ATTVQQGKRITTQQNSTTTKTAAKPTAQTTSKTDQPKVTDKSRSDRDFITEAAEGGLAEVELGKLAMAKGTDPAVKQFGQHMVNDHTKLNNELKHLASQKGIEVPKEISAKEKATIDKLSKL